MHKCRIAEVTGLCLNAKCYARKQRRELDSDGARKKLLNDIERLSIRALFNLGLGN